MSNISLIDTDKLPCHIAIIMDGNGRWARKKGKPRVFGHQNGVNAVRATTEAAAEIGIKYLTLYAFSSENWNRPQSEIDALMTLLVTSIYKETDTLIKNNIRLATIGNLALLPKNVQNKIAQAKHATSHCDGLTLVVAISYGSRWEILEAAKLMAKDINSKKLSPANLSPDDFNQYLYTADIPDPELLIRTSGEYRISNFLLWQIAYSELYFTHVLWPDFTKEDLLKAIIDYQRRERRFGQTSEQL